jgi:MFS family permease
MGLLLMLVGGGLIMGVLVGSIAIYVNDRERRNGEGRSIILYATGTLITGVVAIFIFIYAVAPVFCFLFPGEECGWVSAIIGTPAFFALGAAIFIYFWLRRGKHPNLSFKRDALKRAP